MSGPSGARAMPCGLALKMSINTHAATVPGRWALVLDSCEPSSTAEVDRGLIHIQVLLR